jgi:hypothetical protein
MTFATTSHVTEPTGTLNFERGMRSRYKRLEGWHFGIKRRTSLFQSLYLDHIYSTHPLLIKKLQYYVVPTVITARVQHILICYENSIKLLD